MRADWHSLLKEKEFQFQIKVWMKRAALAADALHIGTPGVERPDAQGFALFGNRERPCGRARTGYGQDKAGLGVPCPRKTGQGRSCFAVPVPVTVAYGQSFIPPKSYTFVYPIRASSLAAMALLRPLRQ